MPPKRNLDVGFFDDLDTQEAVRAIATARRLTIFTGAGALADLEIPNWSNLIVRLLEKLEYSNHVDANDGAATSQFTVDFFHQLPTASIVDALYREQYPNSKGRQAVDIRNKDIATILYPTAKARAGNPTGREDSLALYVLRLAIAKRLAGCDVHIVTTNYDDSLEHIAATSSESTFSDLGVKVFTNWDHNARGPHEVVTVTHLHGLIPRAGRARDVVFSEQDYIEWDQRSKWRDYLGARLSNDGVTLFVGASLRDYNIAAMIHRFGNNVYALLPLEEDVSYAVRREATWPVLTARYATLRGAHLGIRVLRPDFFGQVCQFLNEATIHSGLDVPDYSTRLRRWWRAWTGTNPYELDKPVRRCRRLREFTMSKLPELARADHIKAEVWVRARPDSRELQLHSSSQTVVIPGEGYWAHCAKIAHQSRYAAVSAFAARRATQGKVEYRNDDRWTHFLAVPIILPEAPHYELPVGVMILLLHAPDMTGQTYFGEAESELMHALSVQMKELGLEFLQPVNAA